MTDLPPIVEQQLRATVRNKGRRKRLRKEMHKLMRISADGGELAEEERAKYGWYPNRAMRRGTWMKGTTWRR